MIQPEFDDLIATGYYAVHHVFPGANRRICEKYGFLVALRPAEHDRVHRTNDAVYKERCQRYFEEHYGSRKEFIQIFGKGYL